MMQCREKGLERTLDALEKTNVYLLSENQGVYEPVALSDDLGIFYFIPKIAQWFGLSTLDASSVFFNALLFSAVFLAIISFFFLFQSWIFRFIAIAAISKLAYNRFFDVYSAPFIAILMVLPAFLVFYKRQFAFDWKWVLFLAFSGLMIGYSNFIRTHSGTGVFLLVSAFLFFNFKCSLRLKMFSFCTLSLFTALPYLHFSHLQHQRDLFIAAQNPLYKQKNISHVIWHQIYLGFSYLPNQHNIRWDDTVAERKAHSIDPTIQLYSPEYEAIIRNEVFKIAKTDFALAFKNILYKTLKMFFIFLKFANIGFLLLFYIRPSLKELFPFALGLSFYSLSGILVLPLECYLAGWITLSTIFGLYILGLAIDAFSKNRQKTRLATTL